MSYNIIENRFQKMMEGIEFIQSKNRYYDKDKMIDVNTNAQYSVQMIQDSISDIVDINKFYKVILFDALIGNSDRHHSNWGIINKRTQSKVFNNVIDVSFDICPLYDNGSSLCAYEDNSNLEIFFRDKMKFEALVNTKSKSAIGWKNQRPIRHFELLQKIRENSYELTLPYIEKIKHNITEENINKVLDEFNNNIISENMKKLLKMYLLERRKRMLEIYNLKDEV